MVTRPGEDKNLYLDVIVLSQGFSDSSLSVLGGEYFGRMVETVKGATLFDRGMDGTLLNIAGRQYLHLSNMMKGLGAGIMPKLLQTYDTHTRKIVGAIEFKRDYLPGKKPAAVKGMRVRVLKRVVSMLPVIIRGLRETVDAPRLYEQRAATAAAECRRLASEGRPFDQLADEFMARFAGLMGTMVGGLDAAGACAVASSATVSRRRRRGPAHCARDGSAGQSDLRDGTSDVRAGLVSRGPVDSRR